MDLNEVQTILDNNQIDQSRWETIQKDPRFVRLLESEIAAWGAAGNTAERTKLKAGMLIEEWLSEANARIHDKSEPLPAKTEVVKVLAGIAGMGKDRGENSGGMGGERFSVTINLGAQKITIEKQLPSKVIDGTTNAIEEPVPAELAFDVDLTDDEEDDD